MHKFIYKKVFKKRLHTRVSNILDFLIGDMGHVTEQGEDSKSGKYGCAAVDHSHHDGVPGKSVKL